mmetsp:Transcript_83342/g.178666  ORF Transcript_83342/g.178666 Transcript_83342/m.178666 type:complete len:226 (+) Transcript_83342:723-1400(+)
MHEETRRSGANLARAREDPDHHPIHHRIQVLGCILEDDESRLAAQLQASGTQATRRGLQHLLPDRTAASEGHLVQEVMVNQALARAATSQLLGRTASDDVQRSRRRTGCSDDLAQCEACQGRQWRWLQHYAAACGQGWCDLHTGLHQRVVPRRDASHDSYGLVLDAGSKVLRPPFAVGQRQCCWGQLLRSDLSVVVKHVRADLDVANAFVEGLPAVTALDHGELR